MPPAWIVALRRSHERLATLVESGTPALRGPSYCSDWTVAQVLSHLGSGAEIFSMFLDAALAGTDPPGRESFPPIWESWNGRSPEDQARNSVAVNAALVERFESFDGAQLSDVRVSPFGMEMDAAGFGRMRLSEHANHTWDVAVMADPAATIGPDAVALLVDNLGPLAARERAIFGPPIRVRLETTDPARQLGLQIGEAVELGNAPAADADATVRLPAEALVRLVYGRLDPAHTPAGIAAEGVDLDRLRQTFPGF